MSYTGQKPSTSEYKMSYMRKTAENSSVLLSLAVNGNELYKTGRREEGDELLAGMMW